RDHDHCQHIIHPSTACHGHSSLCWGTTSHCDIPTLPQGPLPSPLGGRSGRGQAFFNAIQVPCFEFTSREECV
ncbi:PA23 Phospholipase, partial [Peucedramus taeniatus]|nr:PA23 Phospholipase [Peucedramus taeniatus]